MKSLLALTILVLPVTGCGITYQYQAPEVLERPDNRVLLEEDYNSVWSRLLDYAASSFFLIETYEKDSGLMTLGFGLSSPDQYVDCGMISISDRRVTTGPRWNYEGGYVEYLVLIGGSLVGRMNIRVKELGPQLTEISIHARYLLSAPTYRGWSFDSGGQATSPTPKGKLRTCFPTHLAEREILDGITGREETQKE